MDESLLENLPPNSPLQPVKLSLNDTIQFSCHKDIACFNECCKRIDILLTPYDILRLKNYLDMTSNEFLAQYTVPYEMDAHGIPGVKIKTADDDPACPFLRDDGCGVYADRPTVCRYYALGLMAMRKEKSPVDENAYFLVKEEHCLGHNEPRTISVKDYRVEQDVVQYDEMNREWRQVILKKLSSGPAIGKPSPRSLQFFFLSSYNLDDFRNFVQSDGFSEVYALNATQFTQLETDDIALLKFAFSLLKQVLFGEMTIPLQADAEQKRVQRRQEHNNSSESNS